MNTIFKGILIGIGKILPGISGSLIAISVGIYERCIEILSNIKREFMHNIKFIFLLCVGILIGIIVGSKFLSYIIIKYYYISLCIFIGIIISMTFNIYRMVNINIKNIFYVLIPIIFAFIINNFKISLKLDVTNIFIIFILGFIDAVTMIIPGISGTVVFIMLGVYEYILSILGNALNVFTIVYFIGIIFGVLVISKIVNYFFKYHYNKMYLMILGFSISALLFLINKIIQFNFFKIIIGFIFIIIGVLIGIFFDKK